MAVSNQRKMTKFLLLSRACCLAISSPRNMLLRRITVMLFGSDRSTGELKRLSLKRLLIPSAYFQKLMSTACPFSSQQEFPVSVCQRFMNGLNLHLMTGFCRSFPNHSVLQQFNALHQRWMLQLMLQAVQQAEDNFVSTQRMPRRRLDYPRLFSQTPP